MKKGFIILSCLLYVQNAYCDNPPFNLESMKADYIAGKIDLATATALCKQIVNYAKVTEIEVLLPYTSADGKEMWHSINKDDCEPSPDWDYDRNLSWVWNIAMYAARIVVETGVKEHSQCHQSFMESQARTRCGRFEMSNWTKIGYTISGLNNMNIDCSKTDNRCVVTRPASDKNGKNVFYTACCLIPIINCESITNDSEQIFSGTTGDISLRWNGFTDKALVLDDFGYDCKPKTE